MLPVLLLLLARHRYVSEHLPTQYMMIKFHYTQDRQLKFDYFYWYHVFYFLQFCILYRVVCVEYLKIH